MSTDSVTDAQATTAFSAWREELGSAALVGTGRRQVPPPPTALGVAPPEGRGREALLLDLAAFDDVVRRADQRVGAAEPLEPAAPETRPDASPQAVRVLQELLGEGKSERIPRDSVADLVEAWLELADARGVVVPFRLLPGLIRFQGVSRPLGPQLAWGERGRWLRPRSDDEVLLDGLGDASVDELVRGLKDLTPTGAGHAMLRLSDAEPAAVVGAIRTVWSTLSADTRTRILPRLPVAAADSEEGRGAVDPLAEGFLEACLDDRAAGVRAQARHVLTKLPDSRFAARMAARLRPLIVVEGGLLRQTRVSVRLPDVIDDEAERDGMPKQSGGRGHDLEAWLDRILRAAPLSVWTDVVPGRLERIAPLLVEQLPRGRGMEVIAAVRGQHATDWARALLASGGSPELLSLVPPAERERFAVERLRHKTATTDVPGYELVETPGPWSTELGELALAAAIPAPPQPEQADGRRVQQPSRRWLVSRPLLGRRLPATVEPRMRELIMSTRVDTAYDAFRRVLVAELRRRDLAAAVSEAFA